MFLRFKFTILILIYLAAVLYFQNRLYPVCILNAVSLLLYLHLFCRGRFRLFFLIPFSILLTFEAYYAFFFHSVVTLGILASIFETTVTEASSVFKTLIPGTIIIGSITFSLVFLSSKELNQLKLSRKWSAILLILYVFIGIPLYLRREINKKFQFQVLFRESPIPISQYHISNGFTLVYGTMITVVAHQQEIKNVKEYVGGNRILPDGIILKNEMNVPEKIYFVIGESQWREHLSVYGYSVKTTPFMDSISKACPDQVFVYPNVISPACLTRDVFRLLLSFATPQHSSPFYTQKNLVEMANDAGYQTLWITNQSSRGVFDTYASMIAKSSEYFYYNDKDRDDLILIPVIKEKIQPDFKQFFLINLVGSHSSYKDRYDEIDQKHISGNDVISDYNRTIHHTDRFMKDLYELIKNDSSSLFIYISDHGEDVKSEGHGFLGKGTAQFEIPFIVINNSDVPVDSMIMKYKDSENNSMNTLNINYIISEMMGYSISEETIQFVQEQSQYIFHVDGNYYRYSDIEKENVSDSLIK